MADNPITDDNNVVLYDDNGNKVDVILDGSIYRLAVDTKSDIAVPNTTNMSALVQAGYIYSLAESVNMASAGSANPLVYIENPSGSGVDMYVHSFRFGLDVQNNYGNFIVWENPTVTANGTTYTPINRCIGGGFGASAMNVYTLPTVSANGNEIANLEVAENGNSIYAATDFAIVLKPNNKLLVTGDPKSNNRNAVITVVWAEF